MNNSQLQKLAQVISEAQTDKTAFRCCMRLGIGMLTSLGIDHVNARGFFLDFVQNKQILSTDLTAHEAQLFGVLKTWGAFEALPREMSMRAVIVGEQISPFLEDGPTFDLGCGSGQIGGLINSSRTPVTMADVVDWRRKEARALPFLQVKDFVIPAADNEFNQTTILTVLHHADDPVRLLAEAVRVTEKRLVIIESVVNSPLEGLVGAWVDWFYNNVIHHQPEGRIHVPLNFKSTQGWVDLLERLVGKPPKVVELGYDQDLNPERHVLFVADK